MFDICEYIKNATPEQLTELAASMFNPVKICNAYLPSKIHNDIIRRANPTWSEDSLNKTGFMHDETYFVQASEIEKKCEYQTKEARSKTHRSKVWFVTECVSGVMLGGHKHIRERGFSSEQSLSRAKEKVVYLIERDLWLLSGKPKNEVTNRHINFATRYFYDSKTDINDYIDAWHTESYGFDIYDFLGLTKEQYAKWVENPSLLEVQ